MSVSTLRKLMDCSLFRSKRIFITDTLTQEWRSNTFHLSTILGASSNQKGIPAGPRRSWFGNAKITVGGWIIVQHTLGHLGATRLAWLLWIDNNCTKIDPWAQKKISHFSPSWGSEIWSVSFVNNLIFYFKVFFIFLKIISLWKKVVDKGNYETKFYKIQGSFQDKILNSEIFFMKFPYFSLKTSINLMELCFVITCIQDSWIVL